MCGIVGAITHQPVAKLLLEGLKRLEYRGYDSAGIALLSNQHELIRTRVVGKVRDLEAAIDPSAMQDTIGIAHTRWATHGAPTEHNAHPFISHDEIALVHNGIIENHAKLRDKLKKLGYQFHSETDTEVIVHLIHHHHKASNDFLKAIRLAVNELEGAYALSILHKDYPNRLIAVRQGSPLVIGKGTEGYYIASDPLALLSVTQEFIYLEDGDLADIYLDRLVIIDENENKITRLPQSLNIQYDAIERGEHRHYMKKEITDQPDAIASCLEGRIAKDHLLPALFGTKAEATFPCVEHIHLVACGTSFHAAIVARYWIEALAKIPCTVEIASEFRYRNVVPNRNSLFVTLSQSGETADTLAALRLAKQMKYLSTLAICNVPGSSMMREAEMTFLTRAGVEIGVASTKAFITQLTALFLLTLSLRRYHDHDRAFEAKMIDGLMHLPTLIKKILQQDASMLTWAQAFTDKNHTLFLGRDVMYPIALEGALKMKEISYIHAEGYPAGELKHGPLALVDPNMPVIVVMPGDHVLEKNLSNLQEVSARGGKLFVITDQVHLLHEGLLSDARVFAMPSVAKELAPILYTVPLQLLSYHVAVIKGTDVDQPRNLAKSVTVE